MDENIPTKMFDAKEIQTLKEVIAQKWIVYEASMIQAIENTTLEDGQKFDPEWLIKMYVKIATSAMKVNPRTWDMIPDEELRKKTLDTLSNIMLWKSWASKWLTVNIQNNSWLFNMKIPEPWEHLIH